MILFAESDATSPWWLAAIVLPLAGFCAYLVHWILAKQEKRETELAAREVTRETREEKRAEQAEAQTRAMQEMVTELRRMSEQQEAHSQALHELPERLAALSRRPA